jgi:hypothetical protein
MINRIAVVAVLTAAAWSSQAAAITITEWDLLGAPGNQASTAASLSAANVTGGTLARGPGLAGVVASNSLNASGWNGAAGDYLSFGFTVDTGYAVDLASLFIGTRSSSTGPGSLGLYWNGDGYAAPLFTFVQSPGGNFVNSAVDLTALPDLTGPVEFRIAQIGTASANGGATAGNGTFRVTPYFEGASLVRNLGFTGSVTSTVVPVPAAVWLFGGALAGLGALRRRPA